MKDIKPKYKTGLKVKLLTPSLYGETEGEIVEIERTYKTLDKWILDRTGEEVFEENGLVTFENSIKSIKIPYTFDGTYLVVDFGQDDKFIRGKRTSKLHGIVYTIQTEKIRMVLSERQIVPL
jgi:hypothetical protein